MDGHKIPDEREIREFRATVYDYFERHGRRLPWRETTDPYCILVSEIMLQQTQVARVVEKFHAFTARFPDFSTLAATELREVLAAWSGLGYNRRALMLKRLAEAVVERHHGILPSGETDLRTLPGIGPYTAAAVRAFAFDLPAVVIETNIRGAVIHHFFPGRDRVTDAEIRPIVEATMDRAHPRRWYSALMDYGAHLKASMVNPSRRSAHHTRQSPFRGSDRELRGMVLRLLLETGEAPAAVLLSALPSDEDRVRRILSGLAAEEIITETAGTFRIV